MKLSVVILNYNVRYFLELCLQSVEAALVDIPSEIIVIDNNSNDASCEMVISKFPSVTFIPKCLNLGYSAPTIVNASNEVLVELFLKRKIGFLDIVKTISKIFKDKEFKKYAKRKPISVHEIMIIDNWARLKTLGMCVR